MKKVLVTGGAGYVGSVLTPKLLDAGHHVIVYDLLIFGANGLPQHENLKLIRGDIRDTPRIASLLGDVDTVIHMACISNDPSFELNPSLSKSINYDCFTPLVKASRDRGVGRFIYISTSSVYGVSDAPNVTEDHPLVPLTDYNKYKGMCEPILLAYRSDHFTPLIIRPATVCGVSPRMRFDLTVNILTNHGYNNRKITVLGGNQKRPNIHIEDLTDLYVTLVDIDKSLIDGEIFNVSYQNNTVSEIAKIVHDEISQQHPDWSIPIQTTTSDDLRSYHVSSDKIKSRLGYTPKRPIQSAVQDICTAFEAGKFPDSLDNDTYFNVKMIKKAGLQ